MIFDQTVAENIACGKLDASLEEIGRLRQRMRMSLLRDCRRDMIRGWVNRARGWADNSGLRLPGFCAAGANFVLDEATAALDSKAEEVRGD